MRPVCMTYPRWATSRAMSAFCSTSRIGVPSLLISTDRLEDPLDEDGRQPHRGLVEHEQLRPSHHRPSDRAHLLLAAGHRPGLLRPAFRKSREEREDMIHVRLDLRLVVCAGTPPSRGSRRRVIRGNSFRPSGDCEMPMRTISCAGLPRDVVSHESDRSLARVVEPVDGAEGRRLPGAVRADERHDLALAHVDRDALERLDRPVERVDVRELEDRAAARGQLTAAVPR